MKRVLSWPFLLLFALGAIGAASAEGLDKSSEHEKASPLSFAGAPEPVDVRLVIEHELLVSGTPSRIGVLFEIEPGWHIYAEDPGDAGIPTRVEWILPEGFSASALNWPAPETFEDPGDIRTFGYSKRALISSGLQVGPEALQEKQNLQASASWLACKEICIPGKALLNLEAVVGFELQSSKDAELFEAFSG